ncbi:hypothetical protein TNCV_3691591 [Trichonephila clavipes]|nr:hypothetical protein TNCV_3691591 [Trichonephila clavipes]
MDFTEINSRGKQGELLEHIDRQNSRFRTAKTTIIKFGLHSSFVELESAKRALNELFEIKHRNRLEGLAKALHGSPYVVEDSSSHLITESSCLVILLQDEAE